MVVARGSAVTEEEAPIGQRVMIHHYSACGGCKHCRVGYTQMCLRGHLVHGSTADGGHAPFMRVGPGMLAPQEEGLTFEEGAAIACGTGTAYPALKRLDVLGRDTLAVFGQGRVGLSATLLARPMGARVIAVDPEGQAYPQALQEQLSGGEKVAARGGNTSQHREATPLPDGIAQCAKHVEGFAAECLRD
jgi:D-arabinose 1-dehydrogenase-like Zn-dependent alcohol dehydrogenase